MEATIETDPSNPGKVDFVLLPQSFFTKFLLFAKAKVNHDGSAAIARWAIYWAQHKNSTMHTHYAEVRPIPYARVYLSSRLWGGKRTVTTDCSGASDIVAALAGLDVNPAGYPWGSGEGNSGSFYANAAARFTNVRKIKVGDYAAYGADGDEHISIIVAVKPEPMVVSHGSSGGPFLQPLSLDTRPRTFLRVNTKAKVVHFPPKR